jgi:preprotein translocase subunit YajC
MTQLSPLILAQAQPAWFSSVIMLAPMIVLFYFLIIRPQQKHAKELENFRSSLKIGDAVVTIGGVHGSVTEVASDAITVEVAKGVRLKFERAAIARMQKPAAEVAAP